MSVPGTNGKRILVVEDDPGFQELMGIILSKEFDLKVCGSVEEALPELETNGYHLIITDINLLGMTGFEILARVRQSSSRGECPVVVCSSQTDADTKQKALNMGAADFIAKPYDGDDVLALARRLVNRTP